MRAATDTIASEISMDAPWALIEKFAVQHREKPDDANTGADMIADSLRRLDIPVVMYEPNLFLSLPISAEVRIGTQAFAAKPPAFCASVPEGVEGSLIYVPAAGGGTPLDRNPSDPESIGDVRGKGLFLGVELHCERGRWAELCRAV